MRSYWRTILVAAAVVAGSCGMWGQDAGSHLSVLHIASSATTTNRHFPQFVSMYPVLDGANSTAEAHALTGTITLENHTPDFSEVLWVLAYWEGQCPKDGHTIGANIIWSDILKNPAQSNSKFKVDLHFPHPLPLSGCIGLIFAGGPLDQGNVSMAADLNLTYQASPPVANTVVYLAGEYCFGQNWGCQNAIVDDTMAFAVPITMPAGHLAELYGNISDSTFDGTDNFGPLPTGNAWGAVNDFYLLPGGCTNFQQNLNSQGFPNPQLLSTLYGWLPADAVHLASVPMEYKIPPGGTGAATLQKQVETIFPDPLAVNSGDCIVVIYGRTGNGATDNETQVRALLTP